MKNEVICGSCQTANPFHQLACQNCKNYLRERIYNLDLWQLLGRLIEKPKNAFTKIIFSEQKNFVFSLILILSVKVFINIILFSAANQKGSLIFMNFLWNYLIVLSIIILLIVSFAFLIKVCNHWFHNKTRAKDIFAVLSYSQVPYIFALLILFPLELIFFGEYLFSNNPSPFIIKETAAYIFAVLELLIIIWSLFLVIVALITLTKSFVYSFAIGIVFNMMILYSQYLLSLKLFEH